MLLAATLLLAIWLYGLNLWSRWQMRHIPGPTPRWLFGNIELPPRGKIHEQFVRLAQEFGPCFKFFMGRLPVVVISDPELIRQVTIKQFSSAFHDRPIPLTPVGGPGDVRLCSRNMLLSKGKFWTSLRCAAEPLFHTSALESYSPLMNMAVDELLDKIGSYNGAPVNILSRFSELTMDVVGSTAFGVQFEAQKSDVDSLGELRLLKCAKSVFQPFGGLPKFLPLAQFIADGLVPLIHLTAKIVCSHKINEATASRGYMWGASSALLHNSLVAENEDDGEQHQLPAPPPGLCPASRKAFIEGSRDHAGVCPRPYNLMTRLHNCVNRDTGARLTHDDICAQGLTFILAGYETTSLALSYATYALARDQVLQDRVAAEVLAVISNNNQDSSSTSTTTATATTTTLSAKYLDQHLSLDDLDSLPLTKAVFLEALRMWPPVTSVPSLSRISHAPTELGGYHIPKDVRVMINIYALHHDPEQFPDPYVFRPERHLPGSEEAKRRHSAAFIPFGVGPRKCIGTKLAMAEGVLVLARLMAKMRVELDTEHHQGPLDLRTSMTLSPTGGIWVRTHDRAEAA